MIGGASGAYLRYPVCPSALAMGGAYSAAPLSCMPWWNPAAMSREKQRVASLGTGFRSLGRTDGYASLTFRVPPRMAMGLFVLYRGDPFLNDLYDENEQPLGNAAFTSFTGKIALSYYISRKLSAGINISTLYERLPSGYINEKIDYTYASSLAFDLAVLYRFSEQLTLTAQLRDAGAVLDWNFNSFNDFDERHDDRLLPSILFGSSFESKLLNRPFIWNMDMRGYLFTGEFKKIDRPELSLSNGWEWHYWEKVYLRLGIGELQFNGDMTAAPRYYWKNFTFRFTGGVGIDLGNLRKGLRCNYAFSTDKIWAGVDQQLGITYTF